MGRDAITRLDRRRTTPGEAVRPPQTARRPPRHPRGLWRGGRDDLIIRLRLRQGRLRYDVRRKRSRLLGPAHGRTGAPAGRAIARRPIASGPEQRLPCGIHLKTWFWDESAESLAACRVAAEIGSHSATTALRLGATLRAACDKEVYSKSRDCSERRGWDLPEVSPYDPARASLPALAAQRHCEACSVRLASKSPRRSRCAQGAITTCRAPTAITGISPDRLWRRWSNYQARRIFSDCR